MFLYHSCQVMRSVRYVSSCVRQFVLEFSVQWRVAGYVGNLADIAGCRRNGRFGLSLYGQCSLVGRASVGKAGNGSTLPSYTVSGIGAQVAPQRCPILRPGAESLAQSGARRQMYLDNRFSAWPSVVLPLCAPPRWLARVPAAAR